MRTKQEFKRVSVTEETYNKLVTDRDHFQKVIGGGRWSIADTLKEYYKIMRDAREIATLRSGINKRKKR